jgi:CheY-like chemotaxis protein
MKGKILLADDDPEILAGLDSALSSEGCEVVTATNGRETCKCFAEAQVHLAVLDLKMPVRDGWDAFERLTTINPLLLIIIITARPDSVPAGRCRWCGRFHEEAPKSPIIDARYRRITR